MGRKQLKENAVAKDEKTRFAALLRMDGCPICRACNEQLEKSWFWFFKESYAEGLRVAKYVDYWGFCNHHTELVAEIGPTWQKSVIYSSIIEKKLRLLKELPKRLRASATAPLPFEYIHARRLRKIVQETRPNDRCLFCESVEETGHLAIAQLLRVLSDPEIKQLLSQSSGLCVHHFFQALDSMNENNMIQLGEIVELQIQKLTSLKHDFEEYFRKSDWRLRHEPKGPEQTAWLRAMKMFNGI